jgi:hypothetical protein
VHLLRTLSTWNRLNWHRRRLLIEAVIAVPVAWLLLRLVPFKRIAAWLGKPGQESPTALPAGSVLLGSEIGWAVRGAADRFPGEGLCLVQGLAAAAIARRRRLPTTLYLGVARSEKEGLQAHAWVRCGDRVVTGRAGHQRFKIVERFAREG